MITQQSCTNATPLSYSCSAGAFAPVFWEVKLTPFWKLQAPKDDLPRECFDQRANSCGDWAKWFDTTLLLVANSFHPAWNSGYYIHGHLTKTQPKERKLLRCKRETTWHCFRCNEYLLIFQGTWFAWRQKRETGLSKRRVGDEQQQAQRKGGSKRWQKGCGRIKVNFSQFDGKVHWSPEVK